MAAEPKSHSTYRPSTIDVISREVGVGPVFVCVRVRWVVESEITMCWLARGVSKDYVILLYQS